MFMAELHKSNLGLSLGCQSYCNYAGCCHYYAPAPNRRGIKRCFCLTSGVCLSVAYIGPKSRKERPRKTKTGTEVAHVSRDSDITFKVKRSKVKVTKLFGSKFCHSCLPPSEYK